MVLSNWIGFGYFRCFVNNDVSNMVVLFFTRPIDTYSSLFLSIAIQDVPSMGDSITEGVVESYVKSEYSTLLHTPAIVANSFFLLVCRCGRVR